MDGDRRRSIPAVAAHEHHGHNREGRRDVKVSWRETTYHPGHYRISLSANTLTSRIRGLGGKFGSAAIMIRR